MSALRLRWAFGKGNMIEKHTPAPASTNGLKVTSTADLSTLLTADEVAALLRKSRKAIYAMVERGQLPGVVRIGRRLLIKKQPLLDFVDHKTCTPSAKET